MILTKEKEKELRDRFDGDEDQFLIELCLLLEAAGVERVEVEYSGSCDEGGVTYTSITPEPVCVSDRKKFEEIIEEFVERAIDRHAAGSYDNEGMQGKVVIRVGDRYAYFDHSYNEVISHEGPFGVGSRN